jgi:hypothetical protein
METAFVVWVPEAARAIEAHRRAHTLSGADGMPARITGREMRHLANVLRRAAHLTARRMHDPQRQP